MRSTPLVLVAVALALSPACGEVGPNELAETRTGPSPAAPAAKCTPLPGCTSSTQCALGCNTCTCNGARWNCTTKDCNLDQICNTVPPPNLASCARVGQFCNYPSACELCTCTEGAGWKCTGPGGVCNPPPCESAIPVEGSACTFPSEFCGYDDLCRSCTCGDDKRWQCFDSRCPCPQSAPPNGSACKEEAQICRIVGGGPLCVCSGGRWGCS